MGQRIEIEVKTVVKEDGTMKFSGVIISRKNEDGDQLEEITITEKEDVQSMIGTLETIASTLRKAIGLKVEEKGLEDIINIIMESKTNQDDTQKYTYNRGSQVWSCRDLFPKCIGCYGCGGLTGNEVELMMNREKIQAIKAYRDRTSSGLRDAKIKVEGWLDEFVAMRKQMDGNI